ncbi:MAG: response regulator [Desulfamplus sp.]|nr:response regulator [Desulfamplus sp.]
MGIIDNRLRLLLIEDSDSDAELITRLLKRAGFNLTVEQIQTSQEMTKALNNREWDVVLSDYNMPQFDALSALKLLNSTGRDIPFIVVSGAIGEETAVSIMKNGAHDYVMKDNLTRLIPAIERELREAQLRQDKRKSEEDRKDLEDQLRQAQKMEAVGQLAGGVAHDFNNMLFIITGCTELMMDDVPLESPLHQNLTMIMEAAQRATSLVRQLLLFSRKTTRKPVIIDMNDLITNLMKMVRRVIGEHILLEFQPCYNLKSICADPGQMEQIVMNLCVNARDAMPNGGKITIETDNLFIDDYSSLKIEGYKLVNQINSLPEAILKTNANIFDIHKDKISKHKEFIVLTISDTGCGIPEDIHERIFEPFFTTKDVGKGTGMGLAAVYGIIRSHEGMMNFQSEIGIGTVFKIYLPVADNLSVCSDNNISLSEKAISLTQTTIGNKQTILIAEDDEPVRKMIVRILENSNYRVLSAENGSQAIQLFEKNSGTIDIAMLDVVMPGLGGDKVMEHIRKIKNDIPIIFLTGYSRGMLPETILSQGNYDTLQKPVSRSEMLSKVKEFISKKQNKD